MPSRRRTHSRRRRHGGSGGLTPQTFSEYEGSAAGASGHGTAQFGSAEGGNVPGTEQFGMRGGHGACAGAVPLGGAPALGAPMGASMGAPAPGMLGGRSVRRRGGNFFAQAAVPAALLLANNTVGRYGVRGAFGLGRGSRFSRRFSGRRSRGRSGRRSRRSRRARR